MKRMFSKNCLLFLSLWVVLLVKGSDLGRSSSVQMDVTAAKSITICTGLKRAIACWDGAKIAITHAFWGRISDKVCPSDDGDPVTDCEGAEETLNLVRGYCEGKDDCVLQARHQYLQKNNTHHCPGVNKYLVVNYTCIPDSKGVVLCDSEEAAIECKAGWKIEVTDAFWGSHVNTRYCNTGLQGAECENRVYAKTYLKKKCDGSSTCLVKATSDELDDKKIKPQCQNLLYLLLNYACKSTFNSNTGVGAKEEADDENESSVENKLLADTSSKELMGLLEKHLNELQTKSSYHDKDDGSKPDDDKIREAKPTAKKPSSSGTKPSKTTKKQAKTDSQMSAAVPIPQPLTNTAGYVRSLSSAVTDKETPALDIKETNASTRSQETVPVAASAEKKQILPKASIETPPDEPSYELTEPGTVRSILARAKEVLKSLDEEREEANATVAGDNTIKKSDISRKSHDSKANEEAAQSVKQVAKLAASLVKTANKLKSTSKSISNSNNKANNNAKTQQQAAAGQSSLGQVTQQRSVKKPKPGPKKSGLSATGPGRAGVGNMP